MPNVSLQIKDCYAMVNAMVAMATGEQSISVVDTSSFVDAGKLILSTGYDNIMKVCSVLVGDYWVAARPYTGKFRTILKDAAGFSARKMKTSFYSTLTEPSHMYNTDLYTNLGQGLTDTSGAGNMWDQNFPDSVENLFYSSYVWDKHYSVTEDQIAMWFRSEEEFIKYWNGFLTEFDNDVEQELETKNRMVILDRIGGTYANKAVRPESAVNVVKVYNDYCGTNYTWNEIITEHKEDFIKVFDSKLEIDSDRLTYRTVKYHDPLSKTVNGVTKVIRRHTPKDKQRFLYYSPLFRFAKNFTFANLFNPQFIPETQGEGVASWQAFDTDIDDDNMAVYVKPAAAFGEGTPENVKLDCVLGILFDEDAIMTHNFVEHRYTTPLEAAKGYRNMWFHYRFGAYQDYSENCIIYYAEDEDTNSEENNG